MPPIDPTAHVMDYPALDLGHKSASRTTLALVDLDVHIWGLEECKGSKLPLGVVVGVDVVGLVLPPRRRCISLLSLGFSCSLGFSLGSFPLPLLPILLLHLYFHPPPRSPQIASHGRCNKARDMEPFARGMLGEVSRLAAESGRKRTRDLLVVTLDHRNHGTRMKHKNTNLAYDKNPHHFVDMAATVCE